METRSRRGPPAPSVPAAGHPSKPLTLAQLFSSSATLKAMTAHIGIEDWQRAVGNRLAQKTRPERLSEGVLFVRVPSSTWAQELSLLSPVVLERLRAAGHDIHKLRFHVSGTPDATAPAPIVVRRAPLPPRLAAAIESVPDPELRRVLTEAAGYSLGRTLGLGKRQRG